MFFKYCFW